MTCNTRSRISLRSGELKNGLNCNIEHLDAYSMGSSCYLGVVVHELGLNMLFKHVFEYSFSSKERVKNAPLP